MIPFRRSLPRRLPRVLLFASALAVLVACNSSVTNPAKGLPVVGNYTLVSVSGAPLPAASGPGFVVRGSLHIGSDVTYSLTETDSVSGQAASDFNSSGTWSIIGYHMTFMGANSAVYIGDLSAQLDSISLSINGHTSLYAHN
jgi:hypothetical protein